MKALLKRNRLRINEELHSYELRKFFSPSNFGHEIVTVPVLLKYIKGKFIDIGCGDMPYKTLIEKQVTQYDSIDIEKRISDIRYLGDIQDMNMIDDNIYDSALCLEVLEHVKNPFKAMSEIHRILKKGGKLILSVPHLSRLHEEPNDFFRYTKYGLKYLFEEAGFKVITIVPRGGIFCFIGHQVSTIFLCLVWHIPILKNICFFINKWFVVRLAYLLDNILDKDKVFALGYTCVVEKE